MHGRKQTILLSARPLRCINRSKYGTVPKLNVNGVIVGCNNKYVTENILNTCMKFVMEHIQREHSSISEQLLSDIKIIQETAAVTDTKSLQDKYR